MQEKDRIANFVIFTVKHLTTTFNLSATNYGTNATFTVTNSSNATVVTGCGSFMLNSKHRKDFNITMTDQSAVYYPVTITVANSSTGKSASITLYSIMQNMSANYQWFCNRERISG